MSVTVPADEGDDDKAEIGGGPMGGVSRLGVGPAGTFNGWTPKTGGAETGCGITGWTCDDGANMDPVGTGDEKLPVGRNALDGGAIDTGMAGCWIVDGTTCGTGDGTKN